MKRWFCFWLKSTESNLDRRNQHKLKVSDIQSSQMNGFAIRLHSNYFDECVHTSTYIMKMRSITCAPHHSIGKISVWNLNWLNVWFWSVWVESFCYCRFSIYRFESFMPLKLFVIISWVTQCSSVVGIPLEHWYFL